MSLPDLTPEAIAVLAAIDKLDEKLDATNATVASNTAATNANTKLKFRQLLAIVATCVLLMSATALTYVHFDRVSRCETRREFIVGIQDAFKRDHQSIPGALIAGFGNTEDVQTLNEALIESYERTEAELAARYPIPDCSSFAP